MTSFSLPMLASLLAVTGAACEPIAPVDFSRGSFCKDPVDVPTVICSSRGSAAVTAPTGFALPATIPAVEGSSCMAADKTCSHDAQLFFQSESHGDGRGLNFGVFVSPTQGPGRYELMNDTPGTSGFYGSLYGQNPDSDYYYAGLRVLSGTLTVTRNDASGLRATFDAELETEDRLHRLSLRGGDIDVYDCGVRVVATCYGH